MRDSEEDPNDGVREVAIWNSETWEQLHVLPHPGPDFRLVPFPMGTRLVTVGKEAAVVWDAASGKCLHSLNGSEFDGVAIATGVCVQSQHWAESTEGRAGWAGRAGAKSAGGSPKSGAGSGLAGLAFGRK